MLRFESYLIKFNNLNNSLVKYMLDNIGIL